jgi:23S rRNA pseudouridine955/2504/2580 synthase
MPLTLQAAAGDEGRRLDRSLRRALPEMSLSLLHRLLRQDRVLVDNKPAAANHRVRSGQIITVPVDAPDHAGLPPAMPHPTWPLDILYESDDFLVLNKPAGLAVHGPGSLDTLVQAYLGPKLPPSLSFRPGPLHRLDRPTSGIVVFSAGIAGAQYFSALLREGRITKRYLALVEGVIGTEGIWEDELVRDHRRQKTFTADDGRDEAKTARTRFKPLAIRPFYTLLQLELDTGRTHQIRAQAAAHGHTLAGDRKYGSRQSGGLLLHAWTLETPAPPAAPDGTAPPPALPRRLQAPLPEPFRRRLREIFGVEILTIKMTCDT